VIADVVNHAIAGIGFLHAAGRLFIRNGFSVNTVMTQNWIIRWRDQCRERNISALTKAP
jgi:hypothetical protein